MTVLGIPSVELVLEQSDVPTIPTAMPRYTRYGAWRMRPASSPHQLWAVPYGPRGHRGHGQGHRGLLQSRSGDVATGDRSHREAHVAGLLARLAGDGADTMANSNAAAVVLAFTCLVACRQVVCSRGALGGWFCLPETIACSSP